MFKLYEFVESQSVAVIPINWVTNDQVKWHDKLAPKFTKKGFFPENKWKTYKVKPLTSIIFEKYDEADNALKKVVSMNKTDIDTDDIAASDIEQNISSSDESEERDSVGNNNPLKKIKLVTDDEARNQESSCLQVYQQGQDQNYTVATTSAFQTEQNQTILNVNEMPTSVTPLTGITAFNTSSDMLADGLADEYVLVKQTTIDHIMTKLESMENSLLQLQQGVNNIINNNCQPNCQNISSHNVAVMKYRCSKYLPLKSIEDVDKFENVLQEENGIALDFKRYLTNTMTIRDLRSFTKLVIHKTYSLELQGQINYSGVKGKKRLQNLISTEVVLTAICDTVPELVLLNDKNEKTSKAEAEFKYQLQHFYDRKRSFDRQCLKRRQ